MFLIFTGKIIEHPNFIFADNTINMSDPKLWDPKLRYCSDRLKDHPLPYDDCSAPEPPWVSPGESYGKFTLFGEFALKFQEDHFLKDTGLGFIFRPGGKTATGFWGVGAQLESNLKDHWAALGRLQSSFNFDSYGEKRLTLATLGGVYHDEINGNLGQVGIETALDWRAYKKLNLALPFLSARYTFDGPGPWSVMLGVRLGFDLVSEAK